MPCDTKMRQGQTLTERKEEVRATLARVSQLLIAGKIKTVLGPTGAIAFQGLSEADRNGVTDACIYRLLMVTGSAMVKMKLPQIGASGRQAMAHGHHSHDGGHTWHHGH